MIDDRTRGWFLAATGMLLVSTDSLFIRLADFDAWTIACLFGIGSTISLGTVYAVTDHESPVAALRRATLPLLIVAALSGAMQIAFTLAVNNTAVSNVVVIVGATSTSSALMAWLFLGERTERRVLLAIALTVVGLVVVVGGSIGAPTLRGDLAAVGAVLLFSFSVIIWRSHPDLNRPLALALGSLMMAVATAPFADLGGAPWRVYLAVGLMGLVFNPLGRVAYTSAPRYAPVSEVALFTPVETVAATAWAWIFFSEVPSTSTLIGGAIVIGAVLFGTVGRRRPIADPIV